MGKALGQWCVATVGVTALTAGVWAQSIYTCVDAKGRKLTSDRPIAECADREQRELTGTGTAKRVVSPTLTANERAAIEEKQKAIAEQKARLAEQKRRDQSLTNRYPNQAAHDKERGDATAQVDNVIEIATKRIIELDKARKKLDMEMEFYTKDPKKAPAGLKRQLEENDRAVALQQRFISDQGDEKKRINTRFDEELARLQLLWAAADAGLTPSKTGSNTKTGDNR